MSKKMMMLAIAVASAAMLAVPAFASATSAHLSFNPGAYNVHGGASVLSRVAGASTHGSTTTGNGTFENTTTGTVKLQFHNVTSPTLGNCGSTTEGHPEVAGGGIVTTTTLPFHLVMLANGVPGILITSLNGHFATYRCGGITVKVTGNGILGTITAPKCGQASNTATLSFTGAKGVQTHQIYTNTKYTLESELISVSAKSQSAMNAHATITFPVGASPTLICT
jgi:hypothetical protein